MFSKQGISLLMVMICFSGMSESLCMQSSLQALLRHKKGAMLAAAGLGGLALGSYCYKKWAARPQYGTFWQWKAACDQLPRLQDEQANPGRTPLSVAELQRVINCFWQTSAQVLGDPQRWLQVNWQDGYYGSLPDGYANPLALLLDRKVEIGLMPFVQKKVAVAGCEKEGCSDIHGDIHSLNAYIAELSHQTALETHEPILDQNDPFKIVNPRVLLVFQGDNVDGGWYGAEVIYTLYRLYCENPGQVIIVRGNHEDKLQNRVGGFKDELDKKFPGFNQQIIYRTYDLLPVVAYVGVAAADGTIDFSLDTHAYAELGFDPQPLLQDDHAEYVFVNRRMGRNALLQTLPIDEIIKKKLVDSCVWDEPREMPEWRVGDLSFSWGDLRANPDEADAEKVTISARIGASFGQQITQAILRAQSRPNRPVRIMIRGHQHVKLLPGGDFINPLFTMVCHGEQPGVSVLWPRHDADRKPGQLWDGAVVTLWSSPNLPFNSVRLSDGSATESWPYQSVARLQMKPGFSNWRLSVLNIPQPPVAAAATH